MEVNTVVNNTVNFVCCCIIINNNIKSKQQLKF